MRVFVALHDCSIGSIHRSVCTVFIRPYRDQSDRNCWDDYGGMRTSLLVADRQYMANVPDIRHPGWSGLFLSLDNIAGHAATLFRKKTATSDLDYVMFDGDHR